MKISWFIDNKDYRIEATHYLFCTEGEPPREGELVYVCDYRTGFNRSKYVVVRVDHVVNLHNQNMGDLELKEGTHIERMDEAFDRVEKEGGRISRMGLDGIIEISKHECQVTVRHANETL